MEIRPDSPVLSGHPACIMRNNRFHSDSAASLRRTPQSSDSPVPRPPGMPFRTLCLHALVPYAAVFLGLYCFKNAWLTLLLYHALIIFCAVYEKPDTPRILTGGFTLKRFMIFVSPLILFGPLLYILYPHVLSRDVSLADWLLTRGLNKQGFPVFIVYFCAIHPLLEEIHWGKMRADKEHTVLVCAAFAAYHVLVLVRLIHPGGLALCFGVLYVTAYVWTEFSIRFNGGMVPFLSHVAADWGIAGATYAFAFCGGIPHGLF